MPAVLHTKTCFTFSNFAVNQYPTLTMRMEMSRTVGTSLTLQYSRLGFAAGVRLARAQSNEFVAPSLGVASLVCGIKRLYIDLH